MNRYPQKGDYLVDLQEERKIKIVLSEPYIDKLRNVVYFYYRTIGSDCVDTDIKTKRRVNLSFKLLTGDALENVKRREYVGLECVEAIG